jgi:hypothetical protein
MNTTASDVPVKPEQAKPTTSSYNISIIHFSSSRRSVFSFQEDFNSQ